MSSAAEVETPRATHVLDRNPNAALVAFVVMAVLAVPLYLWAGRFRWFFHDEWNVLVNVDGGNISDLLAADNEHWTTLPRAVYRVLFNVFGLRSYVPYQLVTIALHVAAAAMLRVVMRRAGVSAWMATIVAVVFLLFGSGDHNIVRAFQMTFTGAIVFGLIQLLLADHGGSIDRRDWLGLGSGLLALACSGVGIAMVAAVAGAALVRRGWRVALFHALPLFLVYLTWWFRFAREIYEPSGAGLRKIASFALACLTGSADAFAQSTIVAMLVVVVLVIGWVLALRSHVASGSIGRLALPVALLFGMAVFVGLTAWSRAPMGAGFASQSRYVYVVVALASPALAVAADQIARRAVLLVPLVICVLLIGVPGNVHTTWTQTGPGRGERTDREILLAAPRVPAVADVPDWTRPEPESARYVTMGWLRRLAADGRLPMPRDIDPMIEASVIFRLSVQLVGRRPAEGCEPIDEQAVVRLEPEKWVHFRGTILVFDSNAPSDDRVVLQFDGDSRTALTAVSTPIDVTIRPRRGGAPAELCSVREPN